MVPRCDWTWLEPIELTSAEIAQAQELRHRLGAGEAACIAAALARSLLLLTDDRDARGAAHALHVEVSGTLGILGALVRHGDLDFEAADEILSRMIAHGYRSPVRSLRKIEG